MSRNQGRTGYSGHSGECPKGRLHKAEKMFLTWRTSQFIYERTEINIVDLSKICRLFQYLCPLIYASKNSWASLVKVCPGSALAGTAFSKFYEERSETVSRNSSSKHPKQLESHQIKCTIKCHLLHDCKYCCRFHLG